MFLLFFGLHDAYIFRNIKISGSEVIPVPFFNVLDGKTTRDYVARVEPSAQGGRKLAEYILDMIDKGTSTTTTTATMADHDYGSTITPPMAPTTTNYMEDRS